MLEILGLAGAGLGEQMLMGGGLLILDAIQPEFLLIEALAIAGFAIVKAIKNKKKQNSEQVDQPGQDDKIDDEPEPANIDEEDQIEEEQKQVDEQIEQELAEEQNIRDIAQIEEQKESVDLLVQRERRLDHLREEMGVEQTPDELLLYPPGVREEIREYERQQEEYKRRHPNNDDPDNDPDDNGGGDGPNGGDNGPDNDPDEPPDWDEINNPYNDNNNRNQQGDFQPFQTLLEESAQQLARDFANRLVKEKEDQKEHEEGKIDDQEFEQRQQQNEIIRNQLESQKQILDVMHMMSINELTDEQSLVQLEKIDQDIQKMTQQQVQVGDIFTTNLETF